MSNPLTFESISQAIEQNAIATKLNGLEQKRNDMEDWAIRDALSKGIPLDQIVVLRSPDSHRPTSAQLRQAGSLGVDSETGTITGTNYSEALAGEVDDSIDTLAPSVDIPDIIPVFLGLRNAVNEWRLGRAERKVRDITKEKTVAAYIGTVTLRNRFGESYFTYADDNALQAPVSRRDFRRAHRMTKSAERRHLALSSTSKKQNMIDNQIYPSPMKAAARQTSRNIQEAKAVRLRRKISDEAYESPKLDRKLRGAVKRRAELRARREAFENARR